MNNINAQIESLITSFAKSKKIGKAQLTEFVQAVLKEIPEPVVQQKTCHTKPAGRKVTEEAIRVRNELRNIHSELKGSTFLVKALASKVGTDVCTLGNQLNWLSKNESMFTRAGKAESVGRGRKQIIWMGI